MMLSTYADWVLYPDTQRSTTNWCLHGCFLTLVFHNNLGNKAESIKSKKPIQHEVIWLMASTMQTLYRGLVSGNHESSWFHQRVAAIKIVGHTDSSQTNCRLIHRHQFEGSVK
eukprot:TRINITY_DN9271_c2_g1_i10.p1 TRINITY_DN9271_c2_g1~~TRINITY_DN9271_c2_g1_i10.p1  ORF type:complete len:113 (+),score=7.85 TRINITY_DN9271_c2_g1_i10:2163-2501(+)